MRVMLRAHFDTAAANEGIKSGALPQALKKLMDTVKPESAYFGLQEGVRSCWLVFDVQDSTQMPSVTWELFQFNAEIEVGPVMTAEGMAKALGALQSS
ncbi:hypothetical protein ACGFYQ_25940 [Streptomyces sp. NPDC048258]|uniref:hypothetical protein n=1 Tax=Streptomyces sp. NPDC048258 TaxID=3365527 RepID=UPI00371903AE